jgi:hypothetical protein
MPHELETMETSDYSQAVKLHDTRDVVKLGE